jgi:hypothetical protein
MHPTALVSNACRTTCLGTAQTFLAERAGVLLQRRVVY